MVENKQRVAWVDGVKVIAIILVAVGHLCQGLVLSGILEDNANVNTFINILYLFHVKLFFVCSGFLYQRKTETQSFKAYSKNILNKAIAFGVPYIIFSTASYLMKIIFSSSVNTENQENLISSILFKPISPYWFLYALFFLFLVSPIIKSTADAVLRLIVSASLYGVFVVIGFDCLPSGIKTIATYISTYLIYFVLGMCISYFNSSEHFRKSFGILFLVFLAFAVLTQIKGIDFYGLSLILGIIACIGIVGFFVSLENSQVNLNIFSKMSKYVMPVFLMHTIFTAGFRSVLIKLGVMNSVVHIAVGLVSSFVLPVIATLILEKIKLDIIYQPTKYFKIK